MSAAGTAADRPIPVIFNPTAGGGRAHRRRRRLERAAEDRRIELDFRPTSRAGHAVDLAAEAAAEDHTLVLAFGGDGTYNEVARGLLGKSTSMGLLPAGTTSVLAYEFDIPRGMGAALDALLRGEDRDMFVGRTDGGEIILIMISAGPDTMVLERLHPGLKFLGGRVGVAVQAVVEIFRPGSFPEVELVAEEGSTTGGWVIAGKARCYAGPFRATPAADPFRPTIASVVHTGRGRRSAISFARDVARGRHTGRDDVVATTGTKVEIRAVSGGAEVSYQIDGDVVGTLPVTVDIHPETLRLRLPAST